jgi:hypothetical protein
MVQSILSRKRDLCGGLLIFLIGVGAVIQGLQYPLGTLANLGPGMFPTGIGVLLALVGLVVAMSSTDSAKGEHDFAPEWRGWGCIIGGTLAFAVLGVYGGLVIATFALVFISALGDRTNTVLQAAVLAGAMVIVSIVVFWWALQLQMPLFAWG